jgi:hypothetical protein
MSVSKFFEVFFSDSGKALFGMDDYSRRCDKKQITYPNWAKNEKG